MPKKKMPKKGVGFDASDRADYVYNKARKKSSEIMTEARKEVNRTLGLKGEAGAASDYKKHKAAQKKLKKKRARGL